MADLAEAVDDIADIDAGIDGLDIGAGHHDILDAQFAELEHILQNGTLGCGKCRVGGQERALERFLEIGAQGRGSARQMGTNPRP